MSGDQQSSIQSRVFHVDRREISYLRFTLESYDGMAAVTTIDPYTALINLSIAPGCEEIVLELLNSLKNDEGLRIEKVTKPKSTSGTSSFSHFRRSL